MKIEIDQSNKIETTNKQTVIAFSNGISAVLSISSKDKKELQAIFRKISKPRIFVYKLFAILIFLLIKNYLNKITQIIIDTEYIGQEPLIKSFLLREIQKVKPNFEKETIIFKGIGKSSRAHSLAYLTGKGKIKPNKEVEAKDILELILK